MELSMNPSFFGSGKNSNGRWERMCEEMIQTQLLARGIKDESVIAAMRRVPRHLFAPEVFHDKAYSDRALPIGNAQTISQPYMVAMSLETMALEGGEKVLEIGAGTGYVTALLAELAGQIRAIERIPALAESARGRLEKLGYTNFLLRAVDGTFGWEDEAPFDAILSAASALGPPAPWLDQLKPGGRLVMPQGGEKGQILVRYVKGQDGRFGEPEEIVKCVFVKLIGRHGWSENT
jgi:protein-L-isoaspartate(D-aspartate) O-methyltransferase